MSQVQTTIGEDDRVSRSVIEAVAEAEGISSENLTPPLYEAVDPDALNRLFAPTTTGGRMNGRVVFDYIGYEVTVHGDGHVTVDANDE